MEEQTENNQDSQKPLTKKERRQIRREENKAEQERVKKVGGMKNTLVWAGVIVLVAAAGFGIYKYLFSEGDSVVYDPTSSCINHAGAGMHIHPNLRIIANGQVQKIPANTGVSAACMRPLHAHDSTGKLHIEFPRHRNFTLGEFFKVWGKPFSDSQILDYVVDANHIISVTVNGEENTEYENFILKDTDRIEIKYESISE